MTAASCKAAFLSGQGWGGLPVQVEVADAGSAMEVLRRSSRQRQRAATGLNMQSSRSHSVFVITLRQPGDEACCGGDLAGESDVRAPDGSLWGRLSIIDLAGEVAPPAELAMLPCRLATC